MDECTRKYSPPIPQTRTKCPHTYGVRLQPFDAFATEPCRPTACVKYATNLPSPSTDHRSLLGYRYVSPDGDGWTVVATAAHFLAQSSSNHCSLITVHSSYTFSAKERDSETGFSYFGSRYYSGDLSIWLSVDPMSDKYPSLSPYVYCANNPVKLVDPNGEEVGPIWPKRGVNTYSWKVKAGAGDGYGVAYSIMGGISLDRHGKTHWMAQNYKYLVNQNLYESSTNPAFEVGVDMGGSLSFDRTWQFDSFIDALRSSTTSINIGGTSDIKIKALVGLSIGCGDGSFSFGAGLGLSLGFSSDPYFIIESISISTAEESTLKNGFTHWKVVNQKYNKQTNSFQGVLQAGNTKTNIIVSCSAVDVNGVPKPSRIWASDEYLKD